jgi:hypothetical protein
MTKTQIIHNLAQQVADELPDMFRKKGPGEGNLFTNQYMSRLNAAVAATVGKSYVEQKICDPTDQCVDFYVPEESTIIEVELSLYNVHTNLDRDIFKALLAKDAGHRVATLLLIGKEPAKERHTQPASRALIDFVKRHHDLNVVIEDIKKPMSA